MGETPFFSLLIPAYDAAEELPATLDSLIAQTSGDWEAVVVDDGSADDTFAVASAYALREPRIAVLRQENAGAGVARNTAAAAAHGTWLLPLDSDDLLVPEALERLAAFIGTHPGYQLYSCGTTLLHSDGSLEPFDVGAAEDQLTSFTLEDLIERNRLLSFTAIDPALYERLGGFANSYLEDYDFFLRALASGAKHLHDPEMLFVYRVREDSKNALRGKAAVVAGEVLRRLAATTELAPRLRARVLRQADYCVAMADRWELERRLRAGDHTGVRRLFVKARPAYPNQLKWLAGLLIIVVSPSAFARVRPWPEPPGVNVDNTYDR